MYQAPTGTNPFNMEITFKPNPNFPFHEDLHISIPELDIDGDSDTFYFAIDDSLLPNEASDDKVKISLRNLLSDWERTVEDLPDEGITFLPFDFSDQTVAALKIYRSGYQLVVRHAWTLGFGGAYIHTKGEAEIRDEDFNVYIGSMIVPIDQFLSEIRREHDKIC